MTDRAPRPAALVLAALAQAALVPFRLALAFGLVFSLFWTPTLEERALALLHVGASILHLALAAALWRRADGALAAALGGTALVLALDWRTWPHDPGAVPWAVLLSVASAALLLVPAARRHLAEA